MLNLDRHASDRALEEKAIPDLYRHAQSTLCCSTRVIQFGNVIYAGDCKLNSSTC